MSTVCRTRFPLAVCLALCSALTLALCVSARAEEAALDLRPHFHKGRTSRYELWYERHVITTVSFQGRSETIRQRFHYDGEMRWQVDSVAPDGSATCTLTVDWLVLTSSIADRAPQRNDTRKRTGDNPSLHEFLKAMTDKPLRFRVSADGQIQKVEGVAAVRADTPKGLADAVLDEQFIEMAYDLAVVPDAPAEAWTGSRWSFAFRNLHELGWLGEKAAFALSGVEQIAGLPIAIIDATDRLTFQPRLPDLPADGPDVSVRMPSATGRRQILWDLTRHEAVGRNSTQSRTFQVRMAYRGQTVTRTIEETSQQQILRLAED